MKVLVEIPDEEFEQLGNYENLTVRRAQLLANDIVARVRDGQPIKGAIPIPDGATNGDMIKMLFPNLMVTVLSDAKPIPYVMVMGENYEFNNTYPLDWWNSPYKREVEE